MARNLAAPNMPIFARDYSEQSQNELIRILRLFFNQVVATVNNKRDRPVVDKTVQVTGFSYQPANDCTVLIINPAAGLATGTVTLPETPYDGQIIEITTSQTITSFTLSTESDQTQWGWTGGSTLTAGSGIRYIYTASDATWNRIS